MKTEKTILLLFLVAALFCFCAKEKKAEKDLEPVDQTPADRGAVEPKPDLQTESPPPMSAQQQDYIAGHLKIENLVIDKKYKNSFSDFQYAVAGKIVNRGDRVLSQIVLRVLFLDNNGSVIGTASYRPVPEQTLTESQKGILEPGDAVAFGYFIEEKAPPTWQGQAKVEIASIRFAAAG